jgi:anion-transporting  ArsA/GET3 family ATPase
VQALLASPQTTFLLVTAPDPLRIEEALRFYGVLRLQQVAVDTVVVNRVQPNWRALSGGADLSAAALSEAFDPGLGAQLAGIVAEQQLLADAHDAAVAGLARYLDAPGALKTVPALADDPHDLRALETIAGHLFADRAS